MADYLTVAVDNHQRGASGGGGSRPPRPPVAGDGEPPHDPGMEARVAVLEQIAKTTSETLKEIRDDLRSMRADQRADMAALRTEIAGLRRDGTSAAKWLLGLGATGFIGMFALFGHHLHWF